jgi:predicted nuclease of predicted toxin-antitoxin system
VDFVEISLIKGTPPKILWLCSGNTNTNSIYETILFNYDNINNFINDTNISCLKLTRSS